MKTTFLCRAGVFLACILVLFTSCDLAERNPAISDIGWTVENIADSWWGTSSTKRSANINFWISFEESELTAEYIESVSILAPNDRSWVYDEPEAIDARFDPDSGVFGGWQRLYSPYYQSNGSVLALGDYVFEITYTSGVIVSETLTVPAPGSTTTNSMSYFYTEDYIGASSPPSGYIALPKRAEISSAIFDTVNSEIDISFSVDDSNIYNCSIWFYNSAGTYVGGVDWFRDFSTGILSSMINNSSELYTDGTTNNIAVPYTEINFLSDYSSSNIFSMHIVLSDGKQYVSSTVSGYDTRSVSEKCNIIY
jgi:hypothetical protein